jgi:hypothetical protein
VTGVLLSGMNRDGVPGLIRIKAQPGPGGVLRDAGPGHREDHVDAIVAVESLAGTLTALAVGRRSHPASRPPVP